MNSHLLGLHSPVRGKFSPTETILEDGGDEELASRQCCLPGPRMMPFSIIKKLNSLLFGIQERMTGIVFLKPLLLVSDLSFRKLSTLPVVTIKTAACFDKYYNCASRKHIFFVKS